MTQPISKTKLIDFRDLEVTEEEKKCHKEAFNSILLKISDLEKYKEVEAFIYCNKCQMILTQHDAQYVYSWNIIEQNKHLLQDLEQKKQIQKNPYKYLLWNCRFCNQRNVIKKKKIFFASNKTKVILRDALKQNVENKKEKSQEFKPSNDPLLLFVIDTSSSMDETIAGESNSALVTQLKKKFIYKKIMEKEEKKLQQFKRLYAKQTESKFEDHLSKNKLLMSLTEDIVKAICHKDSSSSTQSPYKRFISNPKKIGFMFFNSDIMLQKISKEKRQDIIIQEPSFSNDESTPEKIKVNFNKEKQLYYIGKNNSFNYGMNMNQFRFEELQVKMTNPTGQTALGPALFVASGIISNYGAGSMIIVVTDGQGNKGVLSEEQAYQQQLNFLKIQLERAKCDTCLIQLDNKYKKQEKQKNKMGETAIEIFYRKYYEQIFISLEEDKTKLKQRLQEKINKAYKANTWTNEIKVKCQHNSVDYDSSVKKIKSKLFSEQQQEYLTPNFAESKLKSQDYLYPFMTQIVVKYQNINTKQQEIFMTYLIQKFVKYGDMNRKDKQLLNSQKTLENVLQYLSIQQNKLDFDDIPLSVIQQSFRKTVQKSMALSIDRSMKRQQQETILPNLWQLKNGPDTFNESDSDNDKL